MRKRTIGLLLAALLALSGCTNTEELLVIDPEEAAPSDLEVTAQPETEPPAGEAEEAPTERLEPQDGELVRAADYIPGLFFDLRYGTTENFTGKRIYDFEEAWLRYGTVKKLRAAQEILAESGYALKLWDAYRPSYAQFALWELMPDNRYVANPYTGYSSHSNGGTVDLTLVTAEGGELEMPTDFDAFSAAADRDYSEVSETSRANALLLEEAMTAAGFEPYFGEWWHYADTSAYPYEDLEHIRLPEDRGALYEPDCEEYISLRRFPDYEAEVMATIPVGERFTVEGWIGDFARVSYQGRQGYVAVPYIKRSTA